MKEFKDPANKAWTQYLPTFLLSIAEVALNKYTTVHLLIASMKTDGQAVDFKHTKSKYQAAVDSIKENLRRTNIQWEQAWDMLPKEEQDKLMGEHEDAS